MPSTPLTSCSIGEATVSASDLGVGPGIVGRDLDGRRRDLGILLDRQREQRDGADEHRHDRDDVGEDRPLDEELREHGVASLRLRGQGRVSRRSGPAGRREHDARPAATAGRRRGFRLRAHLQPGPGPSRPSTTTRSSGRLAGRPPAGPLVLRPGLHRPAIRPCRPCRPPAGRCPPGPTPGPARARAGHRARSPTGTRTRTNRPGRDRPVGVGEHAPHPDRAGAGVELGSA